MSALIKDMEMPKSCVDCKVAVAVKDGVLCTPMFRIVKEKILSERQQDCPLIEVPTPHGRLIDTDAVSLEGGPYEYDEWCKWALDQYQDAPTIIPAEEDEI